MDQPAAKVRRLNTDQSPKASTELIGHAVLAPARNTPAAIHPWADAEPMHLWDLQGPPELQTDAPGYAQGLMDDICMGMGLYDAEPLLAYTTGSPPGPQANLQRTQSGCAPSNSQHGKQEKEQLQQLPHLEPMHELLSGVPSLPDLVGLESCPLAPAPESAVHSSEAVNTAADNTVPASQAPENVPEHGMVRRHGHHPAAVPFIAESRPASQAAVVQSVQETLGPSALNPSAYDNQHQRQQAQHPAHGTARAMPDAAGTMWPLTGRGSMTADLSALQAGRRLSTASGSRQTEDGRQPAAAPGPGQLLCTQSMHVGVPLVHEHPFEVHPLPPWAGACPAGYRLPPMPQRHRLYRK